MLPLVARRMVQGVFSVILVFTFVFIAIRTVPGDPAVLMAGPDSSPDSVERIRTQLGLDRSILAQYGIYLSNAVKGDLGESILTSQPIIELVSKRFTATLLLVCSALVVTIVLGLAGGLFAASRRGRLADGVITTASTAVTAIPDFWLSLMMVQLFAVSLSWLPPSGMGSLAHLVLPTIAITTAVMALVLRVTRSSVIEILHSDYITAAQSRRTSTFRLWLRHVLRNAAVPITAVVGVQLGTLFGGTIVTETVFNWPGLGQLLVLSVQHRDYPVIQALCLIFGAAFVIVNLLVDLLTMAIDPQTRNSVA